MKVAAYQAPLLRRGSMDAIALIRERVRWCEAQGIAILCCPEAVLGGLADNWKQPADFALDVEGGELDAMVAPLQSQSVTTIIGFSEKSASGNIYNAAAILRRGAVTGIYRKRHPAIRTSVYSAGRESPLFAIGPLTFGLLICNDSNFTELATDMAARGATALFVLSNNGLPPDKADVVAFTRAVDVASAKDNRVHVVRADVAGHSEDLISFGSSAIVDRDGTVLQSGKLLCEDMLVADIVC